MKFNIGDEIIIKSKKWFSQEYNVSIEDLQCLFRNRMSIKYLGNCFVIKSIIQNPRDSAKKIYTNDDIYFYESEIEVNCYSIYGDILKVEAN